MAYGGRVQVGRFVCWQTHGPPPSETQRLADHRNQDKNDNRPRNLRWVTAQVNTLNCLDRGTLRFRVSRGSFDKEVAKKHGAKMRARRQSVGLRLGETARIMGISIAYLCDLEYGHRIFHPQVEKKFLAATVRKKNPALAKV